MPITKKYGYPKPLLKDKKVRISLGARPKYPRPAFTQNSTFATLKALPETSYYQIKDFASDDVIIPFSEYSKLSCDGDGNYIKLNLSNWETGRVYKIEFKIDMDGDVKYYDDKITFTVVNN
jgi:hypothetical protein